MQNDSLHSVQELRQAQPPDAAAISILFSNISSPIDQLGALREAQEKFTRDFAASRGLLGQTDLTKLIAGVKKLQENLKSIETSIQGELLPVYLKNIEGMIASLRDPEAADLGLQFIERLKQTNCQTVIDPTLDNPAQYVSYSYAAQNRGFVNKIGLNPAKLEDILSVADSIIHELMHAYQKAAAEALHLSPFNPDTHFIIHPADWVLLENLCERDAYAKQGLFNYLISQNNPEARKKSEFDVVSVEDFETARAMHATLQETMVYVAANALNKPTVRGDYSRTFEHHYVDVALKNYNAGMAARLKEGENGHIFVRLEPQDFHALGAYGVGPNSLGADFINPVFLKRPEGRCEQTERLNDLCARYNIPQLEYCPTLREATQTQVVYYQAQQPSFTL